MRVETTTSTSWGHLAFALLLALTVMATSTSSSAGTPTPERLSSVTWNADCSVSYALTPAHADVVAFVRVRYWAYDAVRQRAIEMSGPGDTLRLDGANGVTREGTLDWADTGPATRLYVYVSSFDRQGRSIGSTTWSGICQPKA